MTKIKFNSPVTITPRPRWRGFSFALYLTRCRAFILSRCNITPYKRLQRVLCRPCNYTAHTTKQLTGLYMGFSCGCTRSTAHNTRPTQAAIIPPVPRWSVCQRPDALNRYQILTPRRTLHSSAQTAYYNKVYKGAWVRPCYRFMPDGAAYHRPCQPGGVSMLPTPGMGLAWH